MLTEQEDSKIEEIMFDDEIEHMTNHGDYDQKVKCLFEKKQTVFAVTRSWEMLRCLSKFMTVRAGESVMVRCFETKDGHAISSLSGDKAASLIDAGFEVR